MGSRSISEFDEAVALSESLDWLNVEHWHLVQENPGSRDKDGNMKWGRIMKLKKQGWKKGVADYMVYLSSMQSKCKKGVILFIELKKRRTRKRDGEYKALSSDGINIAPEQQVFLSKINTVGNVEGQVCFGADEAIAFVKKFMK